MKCTRLTLSDPLFSKQIYYKNYHRNDSDLTFWLREPWIEGQDGASSSVKTGWLASYIFIDFYLKVVKPNQKIINKIATNLPFLFCFN